MPVVFNYNYDSFREGSKAYNDSPHVTFVVLMKYRCGGSAVEEDTRLQQSL